MSEPDPGKESLAGAWHLIAGEKVLLIDSKQRKYLVELEPGSRFHSHSGYVDHDQLIGQSDGISVKASNGGTFQVLRPTLADIVVLMPRGAQVIYPKDLGAILMVSDIFHGARVLEAGVGSGALSMALLRAGADVTGYEVRAEFAQRAITNVEQLLGKDVPYTVRLHDIYESIEETELDRVLLDVPEPWRAIGHVELAMRPGGILVSYLPTINQVDALRQAIQRSSFGMAETFEVLWRTWHIEGLSVRPDHRMVAHTGFITHARLMQEPMEAHRARRSQ
ncbi:MAG: tRNA (adenine-N1)-methyltransferase [Actinomycetota bacterium]|nr:tRNA (adenine-N1)-methyltransferase [Actinomycetota bacterium]